MESPSVRRSGRRGAAKRKYTEDAFEAAGLSGGSEEPGTPSKVERAQIGDPYDVSDDDFVLQEGHEPSMEVPLDEGNYEIEEAEDLEEGESFLSMGGSSAAGERSDSVLSLGSQNQDEDRSALQWRRQRTENTRYPGRKGPHYRGVWTAADHIGKGMYQRLTFGSNIRERLSFIYARDRWSRATDVTLPSRKSLSREYTMPGYRVGRTFGVDEEDVATESTKGWDWYYQESVGGQFRKRQKLEKIGAEEAIQTYIIKPRQKKHTVFLGPVKKQKAYELEQGASVNFGDAWDHIQPKQKKPQGKPGDEQGKVKEGIEATVETENENQKAREGWILNIGEKINCLDWSPNQEGNTQYLAISAMIEQTVMDDDSDDELEAGPAFTPSEPSPASIQIWSFEARGDDEVVKRLDMKSAPARRAVICTDWGEARHFSWCPMPRTKREEETSNTINLGLLAGIWGDGSVRVIDIQLKKDAEATEYLKFQTPCFAAHPPSTVCTSIAWLSPSDIAVGCANGFVAVFSLATPHTGNPQLSPKPYMYIPIHSTYILNLVSAYPTHPHHITTTAMDGQTRMFSLLDPQKDIVDATRMRIGSPLLTYSPYLRSFVYTDENDFVRILPIRRFFSTVAAAKISSPISAMANDSRWHPTVLAGGTDGSTVVANPMRNILSSKERHFQQTWFLHEWVPIKDGSDSDSNHPGVSRFIDGFKAEHIGLVRNMVGDEKVIDGFVTTTIYEEPCRVTALAWNPNHSSAGWACAGLGSGLVRVEDLAT